MLSSYSPSATFQSRVSWKRALSLVPDAHGAPLNHLAVVAGGAWIPGSQGTVVIRGTTVGRLRSCFSCQKAALFWSFGPRAGLRFATHLVTYGTSSRNKGYKRHVGALSPACCYLPEEGSYTHLEPQFLWMPIRGHTSGLPGSGSQWDLCSWALRIVIYLHTFKCSCLKVWLPVNLNLGAEILHYGRDTDGSY